MNLEIKEAPGQRRSLRALEKTGVLLVVETQPAGGEKIRHRVRFTVGSPGSRAKALRKAQDWQATHYGHVPRHEWGKDHWSLLGYIETCLVDPGGDRRIPARVDTEVLRQNTGAQLNLERMRINERRHPLLKIAFLGPVRAWEPSAGTRLIAYFDSDKPEHKARHLIPSHDDWDCLEDFEREGLLEIISSVNAVIKATPAGLALMSQLRAFKAAGGQFYAFGRTGALPDACLGKSNA